ncbi:MAG: hypothetical protein KAS95_07190 [Candidatus Heimdallarchaeota archaeon]|nr:hypothetical protein [Candidatus Heimdallarchaeota archaeon]
MNVDLSICNQNLYAIHIIEEGISLHSEKFSDFLNIDDFLILGFLSALCSYTYSIGEEVINEIDFGSCRFLFQSLHDNRLLVLIAKETLTKEQEKLLMENLKICYSVLAYDTDITNIKSLLGQVETVLPLELIAEIRKKKEKDSTQIKKDEISIISQPIAAPIPDVKTEAFYFDGLMNEEIISIEKTDKIKRALSNFFLGYKSLVTSLFVILTEDKIISFCFGRRKMDDVYPLIQFILNNPIITSENGKMIESEPKEHTVEGEKIWIVPKISEKHGIRSVLFGNSEDELRSMTPHISRILFFVKKQIE